MGSLFTRSTVTAHAYAAAAAPAWVIMHAMSAVVPAPPHSQAGPQLMPMSSGATCFAADGAPYYNSGYLPGYPSRVIGAGTVPLRLPPAAAQVDLLDSTSWDRPVQFCGVR
jgi:hypothetical protein